MDKTTNAITTKTLSLLLIDSDKNETAKLKEFFTSSDERSFKLSETYSLKDAVVNLLTNDYDAIITDLLLSDSTWETILYKIATAAKNTPIIIRSKLHSYAIEKYVSNNPLLQSKNITFCPNANKFTDIVNNLNKNIPTGLELSDRELFGLCSLTGKSAMFVTDKWNIVKYANKTAGYIIGIDHKTLPGWVLGLKEENGSLHWVHGSRQRKVERLDAKWRGKDAYLIKVFS